MRKWLHKQAVGRRRIKKFTKNLDRATRYELQKGFFQTWGCEITPPARKEHLDALALELRSPNITVWYTLPDGARYKLPKKIVNKWPEGAIEW